MQPTPRPARDERLQDLIMRRKRELVLEWTELVDRARAGGNPISLNRWHYWAQTEWPDMPKPSVCRAMAAALQVSDQEIFEAAGVSVNLFTRVVELSPRTRIMVTAFNDVPVEDQDRLIDMAQLWRDRRRSATEPAPRPGEGS